MLNVTVSASAAAAEAYYLESLTAGDYGGDGPSTVGRWGGKTAEMLGLSGDVTAEHFRRVLNNIHPTKTEQLTVRMRADRRPGFDMTFNVPKSVSLAWGVMGDTRIPDAVRRAAEQTMVHMEQLAATRVRLGGADTDRLTGNFVWASFLHTTSRPVDGVVDPNLHVHFYVMNVTHDPVENRFKALQLAELYQKLPLHEAVFHNYMAAEMHGLGYETVTRGKFWELKGYSRELVERFSQRTAQVEKEARTRGVTDPREKAGLGAKTREWKDKDGGNFEKIQAEWRERAGNDRNASGMRPRGAERGEDAERTQGSEREYGAPRTNGSDREPGSERTAGSEREGGSERTTGSGRANGSQRTTGPDRATGSDQSDGPERSDPVDETSENGKARGKARTGAKGGKKPSAHDRKKAAEAVGFAARKLLERSAAVPEKLLVEEAIRFAPGHVDLTTFRSHYKANKLIFREIDGKTYITSAEALKEEQGLIRVAEGLKGKHFAWQWLLSKEGAKTIARQINDCKDGVVLLEGPAGTGKTMIAKELAAMNIGSFFAIGPTAKSSRGTLREQGFKNADTIARFLHKAPYKWALPGGIIWVDEAGLASTKDILTIEKIGRWIGARVVLTGDRKQLRSPARGGCLYVFAKYADLERFELSEIRRQKGVFKEAAKAMADGRMMEGLDVLDRAGALHRGKAQDCLQALATEYVDAYLRGESVGLVTATNIERKEINTAVREELQHRGKLGRCRTLPTLESLGWTVAEKREARFYEPGQVVVFHSAFFQLPVGTKFQPGDRWTVVGRDPLGSVMVRKGLEFGLLPLRKAARFDVFEQTSINLAKGDLVQITKNTRVETEAQKVWNAVVGYSFKRYSEVTNGSSYRVKRIGLLGAVVLENGVTLESGFPFMRHGYCGTAHSLQSAHLGRVIVCLTNRPLARDTDRMMYVGVTRGVTASVYVADHIDLEYHMTKRSPVVTAIDVADGHEKKTGEPKRGKRGTENGPEAERATREEAEAAQARAQAEAQAREQARALAKARERAAADRGPSRER